MHRMVICALAFLGAAAGCEVSSDSSGEKGADYAGPVVTGDDGAGGADSGSGSGSDSGSGSGSDTGSGSDSGAGAGGGEMGATGTISLSTGCPVPYTAAQDVYTPFRDYGAVSAGTPATYPWEGPSGYPGQVEDFRAYTAPAQVECGANKATRDYLDVTAGCLDSVVQGGDKRGQVQLTSDGYYRSFALPWDAANQQQVAWGDVGTEYKFYFSDWTGTAGNPGFKAFARYLTEYDLYVGSWRRDGVVQIQKKHCGTYTILKRNPSYGPPSPNTWHTIRFEVVGDEQRLYLDGTLAMTTHDSTITHGTAGIRIDSADGALIDDWRTFAP